MKFEELKVFVVDKVKLDSYIDKTIKEEIKKAGDSAFAPKLKEGQFFNSCSAAIGIVVGHNTIINDECIIFEKIDVYSNIKTETENSFGVFPMFTITFEPNDLVNEIGGEIKPIIEFMGSRYNYNDRIARNQINLLGKLK